MIQKLKNLGPWILGVVGSLVLYLKFVHNPRVAKEARVKLKLKELEKRRRSLEESEADTRESEARLEAKKKRLERDLESRTHNRDADDAVDRMAERFGWTD